MGARCTGELKKKVRYKFEEPDDVLVFGYTVDEKHRAERFIEQNFDTALWPVLIDAGLTHNDCTQIIKRAGIEIPAMYKLGYKNNNCIGCVKGGAGYWNKIRVDFPEVFERMAKVEDALGRTINKRRRTKNGVLTTERLSLRDLPPDMGRYAEEPETECGILCQIAEEEIDVT